MSYDPPRLIGSASSSAAEVSLQTNTQFEFSISDPNDIPANAEVALIVGSGITGHYGAYEAGGNV